MKTLLVIWGLLDIIALFLLWSVEDKDYWDDLFEVFGQKFLKMIMDIVVLLVLFPFTIFPNIVRLIKQIKK